MTNEQKEQIKKLRTEDGETLQQIANRFNITRERVRQLLKVADISGPRTKDQRYLKYLVQFSTEEMRRVLDEELNTNICNKYHIPFDAVIYLRRKLDIPERDLSGAALLNAYFSEVTPRSAFNIGYLFSRTCITYSTKGIRCLHISCAKQQEEFLNFLGQQLHRATGLHYKFSIINSRIIPAIISIKKVYVDIFAKLLNTGKSERVFPEYLKKYRDEFFAGYAFGQSRKETDYKRIFGSTAMLQSLGFNQKAVVLSDAEAQYIKNIVKNYTDTTHADTI